MSTTKQALRADIMRTLRALPGAYVQEKSARLRRAAESYWQGAGMRICLYAPMAHEVDLLPLLREHPEHEYYLPRCLPKRRLSFHRVLTPEHDLLPGAWGILEPRPELPELPPEQAELILVPGVAFTPRGQRLGYGGGYYDRYLPRCPQARTLALALAEQMQPELPTDAHDCTIGHVLWA